MYRFVLRLLGAVRLNPGTYEDVEADVGATGQAIAVIVLSSVAAAVGLAGVATLDVSFFIIQMTGAFVAWLVWSTLIYLIGVHLLPGPETRSNVGEVLRTTGFAAAPGLFRAFGALPIIGAPLFVASSLWMLAAMFVAIRQALDYRHVTRALAVCVIGWGLSLLFVAIIGFAFAPPVW
jgi:Yip1 domain